MWSTIFRNSFLKNVLLYMNGRLSKIRSVHTYVMSRAVYFDWICNLFHGLHFEIIMPSILQSDSDWPRSIYSMKKKSKQQTPDISELLKISLIFNVKSHRWRQYYESKVVVLNSEITYFLRAHQFLKPKYFGSNTLLKIFDQFFQKRVWTMSFRNCDM